MTIFTRYCGWGAGLLLPLVLAACASHQSQHASAPASVVAHHEVVDAPSRFYPPPGPPEDPWGPYIREAATRYNVPEKWVRAVMHQESGGEEQAVSPVGALGLMQLMPDTYEELRERYSLGDDPFDPHNNILAGVAYIREMYDRFGAPGFLAAYDAGPGRVDAYLAGDGRLPEETVNYLAAITPHLGTEVGFSGPFARYALRHGTVHLVTVASLASGCDLNAAYNPKHPCSSLERAAAAPAPSAPIQVASISYCDPDAAYDPKHPCHYTSSAQNTLSAPPVPPTPPARPNSGASRSTASQVGPDSWAIQVGAFANLNLARAIVEGARNQAPAELRTASFAFPPVTSSSGGQLYRARLIHLSANEAANACQLLNRHQLPCIVVQPGV